MTLFWQITRLSFQRQLTYRAANLAGLATNLFFGFMRAAVMVALYGARAQFAGIDLQGAITFTGLSQSLIAFLSLFSWYDLMNSVSRGEIASDLLKPMNAFTYWLGQDVGRALAVFLLRSLPLMIAYALIFNLSFPSGALQWLAFALSLLLAGLVSFAWRFLVNLSAFWTLNAIGVGRFAFGMSWFISGFFMPLRFLPTWLQQVAHFTPFPSMINTVVEVYLGTVTGAALLQALALQAAWFAALALVAQLVLKAGMRKLVIQGG